MPVSSPPSASTTTTVVEAQSAVPSASGSSVGIVKADTEPFDRHVDVGCDDHLSPRQELEDLLLERLRDEAARVGVAAA